MEDKKISKISVLLSNEEFIKFSDYCHQNGYKKSTLIQRLIREHLSAEGYISQESLPFKYPEIS